MPSAGVTAGDRKMRGAAISVLGDLGESSCSAWFYGALARALNSLAEGIWGPAAMQMPSIAWLRSDFRQIRVKTPTGQETSIMSYAPSLLSARRHVLNAASLNSASSLVQSGIPQNDGGTPAALAEAIY